MLTQLRERYQELTASDYQVIVITPSTSAYLEQFVNAFGPYPFPIYGDPKRELYNNMGHLTMQKSKLLLKAAKIFVTKGSKAFFPEDADQKQLIQTATKTHDVFIQGGTWLFDEQGNVLWNHIDTAPEDHASIDLILFKMNR